VAADRSSAPGSTTNRKLVVAMARRTKPPPHSVIGEIPPGTPVGVWLWELFRPGRPYPRVGPARRPEPRPIEWDDDDEGGEW